jgi:hypothetical protein
MPEPMGWQVLEALAAVLDNMVGERPWGGSYPRQPIVDHHYRTPRTTEDFLRFRVLETSGSTSRITNINPVNNVTQNFQVKIEATIIGNLEQPPQAWVQRVRDDLLTTVLKNLTLGGLTSGFDEEITWGSSEAETEFGQQVTLTAIVGYHFRESKEVA